MNDLISRQDAIGLEYIVKNINGVDYVMLSEVQMKLRKMPSVQPERTGKWIDADGDNAICGCCNRLNHLYGTYCKHCGAKMER